jgi:hypothetical protein
VDAFPLNPLNGVTQILSILFWRLGLLLVVERESAVFNILAARFDYERHNLVNMATMTEEGNDRKCFRCR